MPLLYTGLRLTELVALDVGDARISARKGLLVVRSGKGDRYREVPLNRPVRDALEAWVKVRAKPIADGEPALFVGPQGRRLSPRAVDMVIRNTARGAGLELSAHVLRHTCVTNLVSPTTAKPTRSLRSSGPATRWPPDGMRSASPTSQRAATPDRLAGAALDGRAVARCWGWPR